MTGITNPTEEYFKDGVWGWDGSRWRKLGLALWYYESYTENLGTTASGSDLCIWSSAVPAGYIYIINAASIRNTTRAVRQAEILIRTDTNIETFIGCLVSPAQYQALTFTGNVVLSSGWRIFMTMSDCSADDIIQAGVAGYKVKIT